MIDLHTILPEDILNEAQNTVTLQEAIMSITPSTVDTSFQVIMNLPFINSYDGVKNIANSILLAAQYRPFSLKSLAELARKLHDQISSENKLGNLNSVFLDIPVKILDEKWKVAFLREAYVQGLFTDDEVFEAILKYLKNTPIDKKKPFWKNNSRQHFLFFIWFAPLFEKKDKELFQSTFDHLKLCLEQHQLTSNYDSFVNNFDSLKENNWEDYNKLLNNFYGDGSVADVIKNDNLEVLKEIFNRNTNFQVDSRIESSIFEYTIMLSRKPTLAMFAAFSGSEKCFNYLVEKGADIKARDFGKRTMLNFAIAGGNNNIIKKVVEYINDFVIATRISAEYHRFELFRYFLATKHADLKANDIENGSIFHGIAAANHIKMILFCLGQGCNVNLKDGDGWTPLNCAIDFRALEAVKVLANINTIDLNMQDDYGIAPLIRATIVGDPDIVSELVKHQKLDINGIGLYSQTALHRASQNNNIENIRVLLNDPRIDINIVDHHILVFILIMFFIDYLSNPITFCRTKWLY
ncbi:hypothetical protein TRFO_36698 [Tritrichomonas foetus]|uniref:Uncharacterized protein n=1 Tax=Tritrichomonas foetus TaxID=1144522 RepID=A0A1J4JFV0_9EUKA|nr:hypothetical protein TRFO_36698 [Tritrichomonas foetus]|eukprot:OHS97167.1 hypothetical protein TRFO_36698 [Tritrichomonas foetus]